jgi:murein DD-endopeptidase MepM/ murein hydrolase activator NlpD
MDTNKTNTNLDTKSRRLGRNGGTNPLKDSRHPVRVGTRTVIASVGSGLLVAMVALPAGAVEPDRAAPLTQQEEIVTEPALAPTTTSNKQLVSPVAKVKYSAHFGDRGSNWSSGKHTGLDFVVKTGTNVMAAQSGTVVEAGAAGAYGNAVTIRHGQGMKTLYAHLSKATVTVGQQVAVGEVIGKSGSTGNSTGPHLHFELMVNNKYRDPEKYL